MSLYFETKLEEKNLKFAKLAGISFLVMAICTLALTFTIYRLAPLKITEVKLVVVDKNTGYIQEISTLANFETGIEKNEEAIEALSRYFIQSYIQAHDSYNHYTVRESWAQVRMFSSDDVFTEYNNKIKSGKYQESLGTDKNFETEILSLELLPTKTEFNGKENGKIARARVNRKILSYGQEVSKVSGTVLITYGFDDNVKMDRKARDTNPLGFTVTAYNFTPDYQTKQEEK